MGQLLFFVLSTHFLYGLLSFALARVNYCQHFISNLIFPVGSTYFTKILKRIETVYRPFKSRDTHVTLLIHINYSFECVM